MLQTQILVRADSFPFTIQVRVIVHIKYYIWKLYTKIDTREHYNKMYNEERDVWNYEGKNPILFLRNTRCNTTVVVRSKLLTSKLENLNKYYYLIPQRSVSV